jgi:hypothetical protein
MVDCYSDVLYLVDMGDIIASFGTDTLAVNNYNAFKDSHYNFEA